MCYVLVMVGRSVPERRRHDEDYGDLPKLLFVISNALAQLVTNPPQFEYDYSMNWSI